MTKYLDPERTLSLGLLAVPDAVYAAAPEAHARRLPRGRAGRPVLAGPALRAGPVPPDPALRRAVDTDQLADRLRALNECVRKLDEEVEAASRGIVQLENSREALRDHPRRSARRSTDRPAGDDRDRGPAHRRCRRRWASATDSPIINPHGDRAIIVAAGRGERMGAGAPKAFVALAGVPLARAQRARLTARGRR